MNTSNNTEISTVNCFPELLRSFSLNDNVNEKEQEILRSIGNIKTSHSNINCLLTSTNAEINAQPQDFVILDGKSVRIKRAMLKSDQNTSSTTTVLNNHNYNTNLNNEIITLTKALESSELIIQRQSKEITNQAIKITELESIVSCLKSNDISKSSSNGNILMNKINTENSSLQHHLDPMVVIPPPINSHYNTTPKDTNGHECILTFSSSSCNDSPATVISSLDMDGLQHHQQQQPSQSRHNNMKVVANLKISALPSPAHNSVPYEDDGLFTNRTQRTGTNGSADDFLNETTTSVSTPPSLLEKTTIDNNKLMNKNLINENSFHSATKKNISQQSLAERLALNSTERRKLNTESEKLTITNNKKKISSNLSSSQPLNKSKSKINNKNDSELDVDSTDITTNDPHASTVPLIVEHNTATAMNLSTCTINSSGTKSLSSNSFGSGSSIIARRLLTAKSLSNVSNLSNLSSPNISEGENSPNNNNNLPVKRLSPEMLHTTTFYWKEKKLNDTIAGKQGLNLFIAHDNPQLGKTIHARLQHNRDNHVIDSSNNNSCSSSSSSNNNIVGMQCMLEFKDQHKPVARTHFLLGNIVYSGDFGDIEDAEKLQPRGSACLVVTGIRAIRGDIKLLNTRHSGDIVEIDLKKENLPPGFAIPIRNEEDLKNLLRPCHEKVDVILDPYHSAHQWFPYWEGTRRMAPQFRSKGIGYLRLGDDMSQYGVAFLSLDAGMTYMDEGATSIVAKTITPLEPSTTTSIHNKKKNSIDVDNDNAENIIHDSNILISPRNSSANTRVRLSISKISPRLPYNSTVKEEEVLKINEKYAQKIKDYLNSLKDQTAATTIEQSGSMKWTERAESLSKFALFLKELIHFKNLSILISTYSNVFSEMITYLTDSIGKKSNPHVLIASVECIKSLEYGTLLATHCGLPWRSVVIDTIHLLRSSNKQVQETVKACLTHLYHCKSIHFVFIESIMEEIFIGSRHTPSNSGNLSKSSNSSSSSGKQSSNILHTAANTAKVMIWLENLVDLEIDAQLSMMIALKSKVVVKPITASIVSSNNNNNKVDIGSIIKQCVILLSHREEMTRDSVINLLTKLLVWEILQHIIASTIDGDSIHSFIELSHSFSSTNNNNNSNSISVNTTVNIEHIYKSIEVVISSDIYALLREIQSNISRLHDKIMNGLVKIIAKYAIHATTIATATLSKGNIPSQDSNNNTNINNKDERVLVDSSIVVVTNNHTNTTTSPHSDVVLLVVDKEKDNNMKSSLSGIKNKNRVSSANKIRRNTNPTTSEINNTTTTQNVAKMAPIPPDTAQEAQLHELGLVWFEVKLLLKKVPQSVEEWEQYIQVINGSNQFFCELNELSEKLKYPRGLLIRYILPFDEDTSSADQAKGRIISNNSNNNNNNNNNNNSNTINNSNNSIGNSKIDDQSKLFENFTIEIEKLTNQAVEIRSLIRVKMADDADIQQAISATKMLKKFINSLDAYINQYNSSQTNNNNNINNSYDLLHQLE